MKNATKCTVWPHLEGAPQPKGQSRSTSSLHRKMSVDVVQASGQGATWAWLMGGDPHEDEKHFRIPKNPKVFLGDRGMSGVAPVVCWPINLIFDVQKTMDGWEKGQTEKCTLKFIHKPVNLLSCFSYYLLYHKSILVTEREWTTTLKTLEDNQLYLAMTSQVLSSVTEKIHVVRIQWR